MYCIGFTRQPSCYQVVCIPLVNKVQCRHRSKPASHRNLIARTQKGHRVTGGNLYRCIDFEALVCMVKTHHRTTSVRTISLYRTVLQNLPTKRWVQNDANTGRKWVYSVYSRRSNTILCTIEIRYGVFVRCTLRLRKCLANTSDQPTFYVSARTKRYRGCTFLSAHHCQCVPAYIGTKNNFERQQRYSLQRYVYRVIYRNYR